MNTLLDNISIVLVDAKTPANIGSVARGMMNMGLSRLVLVNPPRDGNNDARRLAAGSHEILEKAAVFGTLKEAVSDQGLVVGVSRQRSRRRKNVRAPRDMAKRVVPLLGRNLVSLVFGNEVNGLENSDLALCHELIAIPSSEKFPSLNLSHAVMVVMYEIFIEAAGPCPETRELAAARELERFYGHLKDSLLSIEFVDDRNEEHILFSLRQLFGRARLDAREVSILQGILSSVDRAARIRRK